MKIFVDLDGVLADMNTGYERVFGYKLTRTPDNADWEAVRKFPNFYIGLPPMPDMKMLWNYIQASNPIVLTGVPIDVAEAAKNKTAWVRMHLGEHVEVRCCLAREKYYHAGIGDILIDDWDKYRHLWESHGGKWITHTSAASTIEQLKNLGVIP